MPTGFKQIVLNGELIGEVPDSGDPNAVIAAGRKLLQDRGLWRENAKVRMMYGVACSFNQAAANIYAAGLSKKPWDMFAMVPFVVNSVFSLELFLKTLGEAHGAKMPNSHEIGELYRQLPRRAKQEIAASIPTLIGKWGITNRTEFTELIRDLNKVFTTWRYIYESTQTPIFRVPETIAALLIMHTVTTAAVQRVDPRPGGNSSCHGDAGP
jgi:hypothetical protein